MNGECLVHQVIVSFNKLIAFVDSPTVARATTVVVSSYGDSP